MSKHLKLRGRAIEAGLTHAEIARKIGISATSFSHKMSGKVDFTVSEIKAICSALNIQPCDIVDYFFNN